MTTYASTVAALAATLKTAKPGDTITLSGTGSINLSGIKFAAPGVTITGDASVVIKAPNPGWNVLTGCQGITFKGLHFLATTSAALALQTCTDMTVDACDFTGTLGPQGGSGLNIKSCSRIAITGGKFHDMAAGISSSLVDNLTIDGNTFTGLYSDATQTSPSGPVAITNNSFTNFTGPGVHLDCMQFTGPDATKPVTGLTITGNHFERGTGTPAQVVFLSDSAAGYDQVTITGNSAIGCAGLFITMVKGSNAVITGNFAQGLLEPVLGQVWTPYLNIQSSGANVVQSPNVFAPNVKAGDLTALTAWTNRNAAPIDPRDAQITDLTTKLAAAQASADAQAKADADALAALKAQLAALTSRLSQISSLATPA